MSGQESFKSATVKYFNICSPTYSDLEEIFSSDKIPTYKLDCVNWPERNDGYDVTSSFKVIYSDTHLYIRYQNREKALRATYSSDQECKPWTEDCMELFIIPNPNNHLYFNIEMSCIGYGIVGKGAERTDREYLGADELNRIIRYCSLGRVPFGDKEILSDSDEYFNWSMIIAIPLDLFGKEIPSLIKGKSVRANVYKCGDNMIVPHYLSWSPVGTPKPNFHTPEYFGYFFFEE